jgi:hypothetical protein
LISAAMVAAMDLMSAAMDRPALLFARTITADRGKATPQAAIPQAWAC